MKDDELLKAWNDSTSTSRPRVPVRGRDFTYEGWIDVVIAKRRGDLRCVVEDKHGRCFIHNAGQIELSTAKPS
jgi:hypothetical protein